MIYAVELTVFDIDISSSEKILYFSSAPLVTTATDTPAHTAFDCRLLDPGSLALSINIDSLVSGNLRNDIGEIVIANLDGYYDYLLKGYSIAGRSVVIRYGKDGAAYPAGFKTIMAVTSDGFEVTHDKLVIRLRDSSYLLDEPLLTETYLGNNALPDGIEGTPNDLKNKLKPWFHGKLLNFELECCNTSKLIYRTHVSDTPAGQPTVVYDAGVALTAGINYTDQTDLETNAPIAGSFRRYGPGGLIRLGSSPVGQVTCDILKPGTASTRTVANIISKILELKGVMANSADITALNTLNSSDAGFSVTDEMTVLEALDAVVKTMGVYYYFDRLNQFRLDQFVDSDTLSTYYDIHEWDVLSIEHRQTSASEPVWRIKLNYAANETVQKGGDLAGSVAQDRRQFLRKAYRTLLYSINIKSFYKTARQFEINTRFVNEANAQTELTRLKTIYENSHHVFDVIIPIELFDWDLMDGIRLYHSRFGLSSGKYFVIIGYQVSLSANNVTLTLWGKL